MARIVRMCFFSMLLVILLVDVTISTDLQESSPVPSPASGGESSISQPPSLSKEGAPASSPSIHSPSPDNSPPAPPTSSKKAPGSSPSPSPVPSPSPSPSPSDDASDISHASNETGDEESKSSSSGSNKGKKAGIVIGVLGAAVVVGVGGLVYKKRKDNIRRSQYGYAARGQLL